MKKNILKSLIVIVLIIPQAVLASEQFPVYPMVFYGDAYVNDQPLIVGSIIQARNNGQIIGEIQLTEDKIYGYDSPLKMQLLITKYSSGLVNFYYQTPAMSDFSGGNSSVVYSGSFEAGKIVNKDLKFTKNTAPTSNGGGGSSSGSSGSSNNLGAAQTTTPEPEQEESDEVAVLGVEHTDYSYLKNLYGVDSEIVEGASSEEASQIRGLSEHIDLSEQNKAIYNKIIKLINLSSDQSRFQLAYFIQNGTPVTTWLGAGERAGALASYISAFNKFPETEADWKDVIKISNGRWPAEKSQIAEDKAVKQFKKIYLREPNLDNPHDNAAVTIMAYGLRPANRNFDNEKTAIKTFKYIFGYNPSSPEDWDTMRAIAYSGASR